MRIDLNCPAEVTGAELNQPEAGWIQLILMNLTDRIIDSCEATVRLLSREGEELGRTVHRARALKGRPHSVFPMTVPMELPNGAVRAEAVLDKVWFDDHDVWRRDLAREKEYESNLLPPGNELNALKFVAGANAAGFPSQQSELWVCVCGRPNANSSTICVRCRRQKDMIFQQCSRNAVLRQVNQRERQLDLQTRGAREETTQMQRQREAEYEIAARRRARRKRLFLSLIASAALIAACVYGAVPALRLWSADTALREDRLEDAREVLTRLGTFPGAESRLKETDLRIARRDGEAAAKDSTVFSIDSMEAIANQLRVSDSTDDLSLADRVSLSIAREKWRAGDLDGAEELLGSLPESLEGRAELMLDCAFSRGERALQAREYETAQAIFEALGDYPDAAEKALEAQYEAALAKMESGDYDAAVQVFTRIQNYQDSAELIQQCWYLKGFTLEAEGEMEAARLAYVEAGDYEDAQDRALLIRWNQAEASYAVKDYESALPLYREMDGWEDARSKWITCATELARAAYKKKDYAAAAAWLEDLPEDTKDTTQIRTRAYYLGAKAEAARGSLEEAISMMEHVPSYADAERNIRNWRIELARQKVEAGLYSEARELLAPVAENYNARQLLQEIDQKEAAAAEGE